MAKIINPLKQANAQARKDLALLLGTNKKEGARVVKDEKWYPQGSFDSDGNYTCPCPADHSSGCFDPEVHEKFKAWRRKGIYKYEDPQVAPLVTGQEPET